MQPPKMIDCHAHLALPDFDADRAAVIDRARQAGVTRILVVAEDLENCRRVLEVSARHPELAPCLGLHPDRFAENLPLPTDAELDDVSALIRARRPALAAIGEVGLDHFLVESEERRAAQARALERFVALSLETGLPLNVHSRNAGKLTVELLLRHGAQRVLLHAFDGKAGHAKPGIDAGFVFSIPPSVVRSQQKRRLVRYLPLESMALESDSPVLGPVANERNEPANLALTVRAIAEIHRVSDDRVVEATERAARRLFSSVLGDA